MRILLIGISSMATVPKSGPLTAGPNNLKMGLNNAYGELAKRSRRFFKSRT